MCIRDSLEGGRGEESVSFLDEEVDAAVQAVGGDGILHQTPDPLDGIVLVSAVLRQPEEAEAGMVGPSPPGPTMPASASSGCRSTALTSTIPSSGSGV